MAEPTSTLSPLGRVADKWHRQTSLHKRPRNEAGRAAAKLLWQEGERNMTRIAELIGEPAGNMHYWKKADRWDEPGPVPLAEPKPRSARILNPPRTRRASPQPPPQRIAVREALSSRTWFCLECCTDVAGPGCPRCRTPRPSAPVSTSTEDRA